MTKISYNDEQGHILEISDFTLRYTGEAEAHVSLYADVHHNSDTGLTKMCSGRVCGGKGSWYFPATEDWPIPLRERALKEVCYLWEDALNAQPERSEPFLPEDDRDSDYDTLEEKRGLR